MRVTALNSTPVIFYPTDSVTFDRTPSALLRLPPIGGYTGRVPHHEPFTACTLSLLTSSHLKCVWEMRH